MKVSVITPTWKRYRLLYRVMGDVARQQCPFQVEHIVVPDGPDRKTEAICKDFPVIYRPLPIHKGRWGCEARQHGVACASGDWLVFWDDDNEYFPDGLAKLLADPLDDADVIMGRIWYMSYNGRALIPRAWNGGPKVNDTDSAVAAVRRDWARRADWRRHQGPPGARNVAQLMQFYNHDLRWQQELANMGARYQYREHAVVGCHLGFLHGDGDRSQ